MENASAISCARIYCREVEKMERPVIGIIGSTYMTQPGMFDSMERAYQNSYYVDAVMKTGGIPVILPASAVMEQTEGNHRNLRRNPVPRQGGYDSLPTMGRIRIPLSRYTNLELTEALMRGGPLCPGAQKAHAGHLQRKPAAQRAHGWFLYQDLFP